MTDDFDVYGTWKLEQFPERLTSWQHSEHPPEDLVDQIQAWWPRLEHSAERSRARLVEEPNVFMLWAPGCLFLDEAEGLFEVQCYFATHEAGHRIECKAFHTSVRRPYDR